MRMTKEIVSDLLVKHATDGTRIVCVGDIMRIRPAACVTCDELDRAWKSAIKWGWIDIYGRLTRIGWRAI